MCRQPGGLAGIRDQPCEQPSITSRIGRRCPAPFLTGAECWSIRVAGDTDFENRFAAARSVVLSMATATRSPISIALRAYSPPSSKGPNDALGNPLSDSTQGRRAAGIPLCLRMKEEFHMRCPVASGLAISPCGRRHAVRSAHTDRLQITCPGQVFPGRACLAWYARYASPKLQASLSTTGLDRLPKIARKSNATIGFKINSGCWSEQSACCRF